MSGISYIWRADDSVEIKARSLGGTDMGAYLYCKIEEG